MRSSEFIYDFACVKNILENIPDLGIKVTLATEKQITKDEYYNIESEMYLTTIMVCYSKGNFPIETGFIYHHDYQKIEDHIKYRNMKQMLKKCKIKI